MENELGLVMGNTNRIYNYWIDLLYYSSYGSILELVIYIESKRSYGNIGTNYFLYS